MIATRGCLVRRTVEPDGRVLVGRLRGARDVVAVLDRVDIDDGAVYVQRTKDEIKAAPEFDDTGYRDDSYRNELGSYYGPGGAGYYEGDRDYAGTTGTTGRRR